MGMEFAKMTTLVFSLKINDPKFLLHIIGGVGRHWFFSLSGHILTESPFQNVWRSMVYTTNAAISYVTGNMRGGLVYSYKSCNG